jgi:hypothetical protein
VQLQSSKAYGCGRFVFRRIPAVIAALKQPDMCCAAATGRATVLLQRLTLHYVLQLLEITTRTFLQFHIKMFLPRFMIFPIDNKNYGLN